MRGCPGGDWTAVGYSKRILKIGSSRGVLCIEAGGLAACVCLSEVCVSIVVLLRGSSSWRYFARLLRGRGAHLTAANATKQANQKLKAADQSRKSPQPRSEYPRACLDSPLPCPETPQLAQEFSLGPLRKPTVPLRKPTVPLRKSTVPAQKVHRPRPESPQPRPESPRPSGRCFDSEVHVT